MFDVGFSELIIIFVLALLVFGPEKLPGMARTLGLWVGRGRALMHTLTEQLDQETNTERLQKALESHPQSEEREDTEQHVEPGTEPIASDQEQESGDGDRPAG